MKKCPKCDSQVSDAVKFCPECGNKFSTESPALIRGEPSEPAVQPSVSLEYSKEPIEVNQDNTALAFVYIAQYAREDGPDCAGVLVEDCKQHYGGMIHLLRQRYIEEKIWNRKQVLRGYITTQEGGSLAVDIIKKRIEQHSDFLKNMLDHLPPKFVKFFIEEVIKAPYWYNGRRIDPGSIGGGDTNSNYHLCLLSDEKVKKLRNDLMTTLIKRGLAATARTYVANPRVDGPVFCLAPEVSVFFDEYLVGKSMMGPLFDENLESSHLLYHQLSDDIFFKNRKYIDSEGLQRLSMVLGILRDDFERVFYKLLDIQAIRIDPGRLFIEKETGFQSIIRQEFFSPLVDHLLSSFTAKPKIGTSSVAIVDSGNKIKRARSDDFKLLFGG
jgi:hypothetical protein